VKSFVNLLCGGRQGDGRPGERGLEVYTGGGSRGGRKGDSQGGGKREKNEKITQHFAIFRNRKNAKRRKPTNKGPEPKSKGKEAGGLNPPVPPPLYILALTCKALHDSILTFTPSLFVPNSF